MLIKSALQLITSLKLTIACLACAIVLVFAGTLAQVNLGLYLAQERYFHSILVYWTPGGTDWNIPVWPGGYLIGAVLLVNLIAAHLKRFTFSRRKIGLFMIHLGLILLLLGQFFTEVLQVESYMRLEEGQTRNYTENSRMNELVIVDVSNSDREQVVAFPAARVANEKEISHPELPFKLRIRDYFPNSAPAPGAASSGAGPRIEATHGIGQRLPFQSQPTTARLDEENVPAALIEVVAPEGTLGTWAVSNWLTKFRPHIVRQLGQMGSALEAPQQFSYKDRTYEIAFRPVRYYKPYNIQLLEFTHKRYKGTEIPKDFSSRIRLTNAQSGEDREVLIYMNNPLRYAGETYYQGGFEPGDTVSILQVVRNPAWLTPYLSCALVTVGLTWQFLMHLAGFGKSGNQRPLPAGLQARPPVPENTAGLKGPELAGSSEAATAAHASAKGGADE
jgi:hypothetical protein